MDRPGPEEARAIAKRTLAEIRERRRVEKAADRRELLGSLVLPLGAIGVSGALPAIQFATAQKTPQAIGVLTVPTTVASVVAVVLWLVIVIKGALYVGSRLLTLPSRLRASAARTMRAATLPGVDAQHRVALRKDVAKERRDAFRSEWRTWLLLAAGQVIATIMLFASAYWLLGVRDTTLTCDGKPCDGHYWWSSVYLSTVTITTLGYGDILPMGASRILAGLEAITGLLYTGVFIAGLTRILETTDLGEADDAPEDET